LEGACEAGLCQPYLRLGAGSSHICAVKLDVFGQNGRVKCWGRGAHGALGLGGQTNVGDSIAHAVIDAAEVNVGFDSRAVDAGADVTCALSASGDVKCWGSGQNGRTGYGIVTDILQPREASVSLGTAVAARTLDVFSTHVCIVSTMRKVMCWGSGAGYTLGYGTSADVGTTSSNLPSEVGALSMNGDVDVVVTGASHSCGRYTTGAIKCWGDNARGQLGYGTAIGTNGSLTLEPAALPPVPITTASGVTIAQVAAGNAHTCAVLSDGTLKCWGDGQFGALGFGQDQNIGDDEVPSSAPLIDLGVPSATILDVKVNGATCVLYVAAGHRGLKCFGLNTNGSLGQETDLLRSGPAADVPAIELGGDVHSFALGAAFGCAVLRNGQIRCWGQNTYGQLGIGSTEHVGDENDEMPPSTTIVFGSE